MKISEQVFVVTGASAGIGKALVVALAQDGANVVFTARRAERLNAIISDLAHLPGKRVALAGDIQNEAFCQQLVDAAVAEFGRIDILINNAGVGHNDKVESVSPQHAQTVFNTNVYGTLFATQAAIPHMRRQRSGQIVNISSIIGQRPLQNMAFYTASKTAVNFISRTLRMELHKSGVSVMVVYPGITRTEFHDARLGGGRQRRVGISAETVANVIIKSIKRKKKEVYITTYDWAFTHLCRLFPRTLDWFFSRIVV